jgi:hypothetical protein
MIISIVQQRSISNAGAMDGRRKMATGSECEFSPRSGLQRAMMKVVEVVVARESQMNPSNTFFFRNEPETGSSWGKFGFLDGFSGVCACVFRSSFKVHDALFPHLREAQAFAISAKTLRPATGGGIVLFSVIAL